ncbi:14302_t:CDS:2, partial [Gigaspora rosea]
LERPNTTDYTTGAIADNCGGFVDISCKTLLRWWAAKLTFDSLSVGLFLIIPVVDSFDSPSGGLFRLFKWFWTLLILPGF